MLFREVILPRHVGLDTMEGLDCWTRNCGRVLGYTVGKDRRGREISMEFLQSKSK
jgi:ferritin-like protein